MATIMDYLSWRGDLSFSRDGFNDIDALIFALLSYLPFKEIVPGVDSSEDIPLKKAAVEYAQKASKGELKTTNFNPSASTSFDAELVTLLESAASCYRFEGVKLSKFEENSDLVIGRQFGAITFTLNNLERTKVAAFRGTDNSLIGWKEDFELAYKEQIPAQESAFQYLERAIGLFSSPFTVCGHSKGGNLAVYAGSHIDILRQSRINRILNFDGPGFDFSVINPSAFTHCEKKVANYIPEESMVGLLLDPVGKRTIVRSASRFIGQHDAFNWEVERTKFVKGKLSSTAKMLEHTLKNWLTEISIPERQTFLEALFEIMGASEGTAIKFDPQENMREIKNILVKYVKLDTKTKVMLTQVFMSLSSQTRRTLAATLKEKLPKIH